MKVGHIRKTPKSQRRLYERAREVLERSSPDPFTIAYGGDADPKVIVWIQNFVFEAQWARNGETVLLLPRTSFKRALEAFEKVELKAC